MSIEELTEAQAGLVFPKRDQFFLFEVPTSNPGRPPLIKTIERNGTPDLYTDGIITCAYLVLRTDVSYGLAHARGNHNAEVLLRTMVEQQRRLSEPLEGLKLDIYAVDLWERLCYESAVRKCLFEQGLEANINTGGWSHRGTITVTVEDTI